MTSTPSKRDVARLRLHQPQNRLRSRRLAATGLADERDHLTACDRQRNARHRVDVLLGPAQDRPTETPGDAIADDQILDLEQRTSVAFESAHAATSTELAKWHALTWPSPTGRSSGRSDVQRDAAR